MPPAANPVFAFYPIILQQLVACVDRCLFTTLGWLFAVEEAIPASGLAGPCFHSHPVVELVQVLYYSITKRFSLNVPRDRSEGLVGI